jgi:hypothetical protein
MFQRISCPLIHSCCTEQGRCCEGVRVTPRQFHRDKADCCCFRSRPIQCTVRWDQLPLTSSVHFRYLDCIITRCGIAIYRLHEYGNGIKLVPLWFFLFMTGTHTHTQEDDSYVWTGRVCVFFLFIVRWLSCQTALHFVWMKILSVPDFGVSCVFLDLPGKYRNNTLCRPRPLPSIYFPLFTDNPIIQRCIVWHVWTCLVVVMGA